MQVMQNAIAHHSPTNSQVVPEHQLPPAPFPPVYILDITLHCMEYPFGQFGSAALAVFPSQLLVPFQSSRWLGMRS